MLFSQSLRDQAPPPPAFTWSRSQFHEESWDSPGLDHRAILEGASVGVVMRDDFPFCEMCNNWADEGHLRSKRHRRNVEWASEWTEGSEWQHSSSSMPCGSVTTPDHEQTQDGFRHAAPPPPPPPPPDAGSRKKCAWCSAVALDKGIAGTRARYCASCWKWWSEVEGAPDCTAPPGLEKVHRSVFPHAPPPGLSSTGRVAKDSDAARSRSEAWRWLEAGRKMLS